MTVVPLSADTMFVFRHQDQHKYHSDVITRSAGIIPGERCSLTNIHPNIHVPSQTLAINSNRAPRMRSICPLSVCSFGEYVYVTAKPISLPLVSPPRITIIPVPIYPSTISPVEPSSIVHAGLNCRFSNSPSRQITSRPFRSVRKTSEQEDKRERKCSI